MPARLPPGPQMHRMAFSPCAVLCTLQLMGLLLMLPAVFMIGTLELNFCLSLLFFTLAGKGREALLLALNLSMFDAVLLRSTATC